MHLKNSKRMAPPNASNLRPCLFFIFLNVSQGVQGTDRINLRHDVYDGDGGDGKHEAQDETAWRVRIADAEPGWGRNVARNVVRRPFHGKNENLLFG